MSDKRLPAMQIYRYRSDQLGIWISGVRKELGEDDNGCDSFQQGSVSDHDRLWPKPFCNLAKIEIRGS